MTTYSERDVEDFFDQTLRHYLDFWDSTGVLHTGIFESSSDPDYPAAAERTSAVLAANAGIGPSSYVLDAGCGCGNFVGFLADRTGCRAEGIDLSEERVAFARSHVPNGTFTHGSVTAMPYPDGTFTHAVSQDALFLVPDKPRSHAEIFRVLQPGGVFAFSDFLQPVPQIGAAARKHVYDRVRWSGGYSLAGYQAALETAGFEIIKVRDLKNDIRHTYQVLGGMATDRARTASDPEAKDWMLGFAASCQEIQAAIDRDEFGWGMITARKP
ncbi:MAG TPA: class I SAM-dependent methyltransferase [Streptosporangiaceae bacterium]|jgi:ubiquinone/menaquinone biosynthesis C-methylase UbiE